MTRTRALIAGVAVLAGACGSAGEPEAGPEVVPIAVAADTDAGDGPDQLSMAEPPIALLGPTALSAAPGETLTVDHLVENLAGGTRTIAVTARNATRGVQIETAPSSLRLDTGGAAAVTTTVRVPEDLAAEATFEAIAVFVDDTTARAALTVTVAPVETSGARPLLGDDRATTATNQRVIAYVVANDTHTDGNLDLSTLRIVAGAGRAADAVASPDGTITYEPFANRTGTDVVLYELCDTAGLCDTAALTVIVTG